MTFSGQNIFFFLLFFSIEESNIARWLPAFTAQAKDRYRDKEEEKEEEEKRVRTRPKEEEEEEWRNSANKCERRQQHFAVFAFYYEK